MFWNAVAKYNDAGLLVIRLGVGLGFFHYHGWQKLIGGPEAWADRGQAISLLGIRFGYTFFGFMNAFVESIGGLLFAVGLFFRPLCVLMCFNMLVAALSHYVSGRGTPGHAVKNAFLFAGIFFVGPGKYSVDEWIARRRRVRAAAPPLAA